MKIALDIDGTITRYPEFFSKLSHIWDDDVYVISFRYSMDSCVEDCKKYNIKYKEIFLAKNEDSKAEICDRLGIEVLFDDDPDFLVHCKKNMLALMVRNEDNFDYKEKQYLFTKYTGRLQTQPTLEELSKAANTQQNNTERRHILSPCLLCGCDLSDYVTKERFPYWNGYICSDCYDKVGEEFCKMADEFESTEVPEGAMPVEEMIKRYL